MSAEGHDGRFGGGSVSDGVDQDGACCLSSHWTFAFEVRPPVSNQ